MTDEKRLEIITEVLKIGTCPKWSVDCMFNLESDAVEVHILARSVYRRTVDMNYIHDLDSDTKSWLSNWWSKFLLERSKEAQNESR